MSHAILRRSGVLIGDRTIQVPAGASIQQALNELPPVLGGAITVQLAGTKSAVAVYNPAQTVVFDKHCMKNSPVCLKAASGAQTQVMQACGGGATWLTVLKSALSGTLSGEWAGAHLTVVSDDAACGNLRWVDASGAVSSSADGTTPGDGSAWKFTVTSAFSGSPDTSTRFVLNACVLSLPSSDVIRVATTGGGSLRLENLALQGRTKISKGATVVAASCVFCGSTSFSGVMVSGEFLSDSEAPFHIVGNNGYGLWVVDGGLARLIFTSAKPGYISKNSGSDGGVTIVKTLPGGTVTLSYCVLERNDCYAVLIQAGWGQIDNCTFIGDAEQVKIVSSNSSGIATNANTGATEVALNGGVFD